MRTTTALTCLPVLAALALGVGSCNKNASPTPPSLAIASGYVEPTTPIDVATAPKLGITTLSATVFERPSRSAKKLGYLRLGALVARDAKPAGTEGCPGGFYRIAPRGYVCAGEDATLDIQNPVVRAASIRPDITRPLPYRYVFVRSVAPQYLRVPKKEEQIASEFKLKENLAFWSRKGHAASKVTAGANDVDAPGLPKPARLSTEQTFGELFGAQTGALHPKTDGEGFDPIPFWLQGGRKIPNVSSFTVPPYAVFANRVRRHTGLAVVSAFTTGPENLDRAFAVTTDLRLVPVSKLKPDSASTFHGVELREGAQRLPLAFVVGKGCERSPAECVRSYTLSGETMKRGEAFAYRQVLSLTGKGKKVGATWYREVAGGSFVKAADVRVAEESSEKPPVAARGEKWIDVSIENQTLVLWEGNTPVYATLVSTGQDGLGDPKTSKSTPRGTFRIKTKHVTATMDSNEKSAHAGGSGGASEREHAVDAKDGEEGKTVRRGQGLFELRDVPWVAYFDAGYALHAAYWHDVFGKPRSHGCVNLSPIDAHRVFGWTEPRLPDGWHGVAAGDKDGTVVVVRK